MGMQIVDWLNLLDEPYKTQALLNTREEMRTCEVDLMSEAIDRGFTWQDTNQSHEYWSEICNKYRAIEADEREKDFAERREAERLKLESEKVQFSSSMKEMLEKLAPDSMVAKYLCHDSYTINTFGSYVTTRHGMLSFLPNGREHKTNPDTGRWLRDGRQEMKPAKLARRLIKEFKLQDLEDADFEKFGNKVRAYLGIVGDEDGEGKNIKLEIIEGEPIRNAYYGGNYSKLLGDGTNLHGSCMRSDSSQKYLSIYVENPDKVKMLVAKDEENKILGRALLWQFDDGDTGMDTIYGPDIIAQLMIDWAIESNYWYKSNQSCHHHKFDRLGLDRIDDARLIEMGKISRNVTLNKIDFDYYPYVDSLYYLCYGGGKWYLTNTYNNVVEKTLRDTSGSYEENDDDDDDYVTLESGDRCHTDDAYYLDYRNHEGDRIDGYYHESDCIYCMDDTSRLRQDCTRVNGDWYGLDDDAIVWVEDKDTYFLQDDTVYCEQRETTIHIDDATQVEGGWCDSDYAHECPVDGLMYHEGNMEEIDGVWVALDNKESYLEQLNENKNETEREGITA